MTPRPLKNIPVRLSIYSAPVYHLTKHQIEFINENIAAMGGVKRWNHVFRIACMLEEGVFDTGLRAPTPFQIIPNGTYSIHLSSADSAVLAVQNVKSLLQPPLDTLLGGYFPSDDDFSVVGMNQTGVDNEKVRITMYFPLSILELTDRKVVRCCNQGWIYIPKHGDRVLSWTFSRIREQT